MMRYSLYPTPEQREALRERDESTRVWWVRFDHPIERVFCDSRHLAVAHSADSGVPWVGVTTRHHPRQLPTDREDVWLLEYGIPIDHMAVAHEDMHGWMEVVRSNGLHGGYREAGTKRWYEF